MPKTNTALPVDCITRLQDAIRRLIHCESRYIRSVTISETFLSFAKKKVWEGKVEIFEVNGHPQAERVYAWSDTVGEEGTWYVVVLEIPPVRSPETAVQAAIAAQIVNGTLRFSSYIMVATTDTSASAS